MCVVAKDVPFSSISSCSSLKDFEVVELDIPSFDYGRDQKALEIPLHLSERHSHDYGKTMPMVIICGPATLRSKGFLTSLVPLNYMPPLGP